ncbi:hypothetical protein BDW71DRAFT_190577, partial [Aspergillus fruticulosus]
MRPRSRDDFAIAIICALPLAKPCRFYAASAGKELEDRPGSRGLVKRVRGATLSHLTLHLSIAMVRISVQL